MNGSENAGEDTKKRPSKDPLGSVIVTLLEARDLPLQRGKGASSARTCYCLVTVRGEEIIHTREAVNNHNIVWGSAQGEGVVWEQGDTVELCVMEVVAGKMAQRIGSGRLYLDEIWAGADGAKSGAESECGMCGGVGVLALTDKLCRTCAATGTCHDSWVTLEVCANPLARVHLSCKFMPTNKMKTHIVKGWHDVKGDQVLPANLAGVSAHDSYSAETWRSQIKNCKAGLEAAIHESAHNAQPLADLLTHAKALGMFVPNEQNADLEPPGKCIGADAPQLCQLAQEKLDDLQMREAHMPKCAAALQQTVVFWIGLSKSQRLSFVSKVAIVLEKELTRAHSLGMHNVQRFKVTVDAALHILEEVEPVLKRVRADKLLF